MSTATEKRSLEEDLQHFADTWMIAKNANFLLGDMAADMVRQYGKGVIPEIAKAVGRSASWVRMLVRVATFFPPDVRDQYPDVPYGIFRFAATHDEVMEPEKWVQLSVDNGWSERQMAEALKQEDKPARLRARCEWCGSRVSIEAQGLQGLKVRCPVCEAANEQDVVLGVME